MTEHASRIIALPLDTLDRTTARYRLQDDDYRVATEMTLSRSDYEELGRPTMLYATLSGEVPQLPTAPPIPSWDDLRRILNAWETHDHGLGSFSRGLHLLHHLETGGTLEEYGYPKRGDETPNYPVTAAPEATANDVPFHEGGTGR